MTNLGDVLLTARRARGMTQEGLALASGVTQAALSRYENGMRYPEPEVLKHLAHALGVTPDLLERSGRIEGGIAVGAHMRRRATAKPTVWRQLEAQLNMARLHASRLFDEVSIVANAHVPTFDPVEVEPSAAARLVRAQWRMPAGPVRSVVAWLESAGVLVIERDFGPSARVDGLSQWADGHPVLLINMTAPTDRKRLTLAHELGHLALHSEYAQPDMEGEANAFAAEFLLPEAEVRVALRGLTLAKALQLKRYWGVSMQALVERAHELRSITPVQRTNLYKALSARGYRISEPGSLELPPESPRLATHIAESLAARGLARAEVATIAGFAGPEDNDLFEETGRRLRLA